MCLLHRCHLVDRLDSNEHNYFSKTKIREEIFQSFSWFQIFFRLQCFFLTGCVQKYWRFSHFSFLCPFSAVFSYFYHWPILPMKNETCHVKYTCKPAVQKEIKYTFPWLWNKSSILTKFTQFKNYVDTHFCDHFPPKYLCALIFAPHFQFHFTFWAHFKF